MESAAMAPHGRALLAFLEGDLAAELLLRREDGFEAVLPVRHFFRPPEEFTPIEKAALAECRGRVLDVGAGSGLHSLYLQAAGHRVTAIDVSAHAVAVMRRRSVEDARRADALAFGGEVFDTLLMLGHGVGIVGDLEGLEAFLRHASRLVDAGGQLLLDSLDVARTDHPAHLAYQESKRRAGRYCGEIRLQFEHAGRAGPYSKWLHVDPGTLAMRAERQGWRCEVLLQQDAGDYLARLSPPGGGP